VRSNIGVSRAFRRFGEFVSPPWHSPIYLQRAFPRRRLASSPIGAPCTGSPRGHCAPGAVFQCRRLTRPWRPASGWRRRVLFRCSHSCVPSGPRVFHPRPRTDPDVKVSLHPARVTPHRPAGHGHRQAPPVAGWPDGPGRVTHPLRSLGVPPARRSDAGVRPSPVHRYFRPRGSTARAFSLGIPGQVLPFRTDAQGAVMPLSPGPHRARRQVAALLFPGQFYDPGFDVI
jgi:hypothetical protein